MGLRSQLSLNATVLFVFPMDPHGTGRSQIGSTGFCSAFWSFLGLSVGTSVFRYPHFLESKCFSHPHPKHPTIQHPRHPRLDLPALTWRTFSAWRIAPCRPGCSMWRGGPCRGASPRARPSWARSHGGRGWHSPKLPKPWENCMDWMVKPPLKRDFRNLGPEWMSFWYRFSLIFYCFVVLFVLVFDVLSSTF